MTQATSHLIRKSAAIGLLIELSFLAMVFFSRLTDGYDSKPLAGMLYMGFHLPGIWLLSTLGCGMGRFVDVIPVALVGWLQCSLLVWMVRSISNRSSRKTAD